MDKRSGEGIGDGVVSQEKKRFLGYKRAET